MIIRFVAVMGLCALLTAGCRTTQPPVAGLPTQATEEVFPSAAPSRPSPRSAHAPLPVQDKALPPTVEIEAPPATAQPTAVSIRETAAEVVEPAISAVIPLPVPATAARPAAAHRQPIALPAGVIAPAAGAPRPISLLSPYSPLTAWLTPSRPVPVPPPPAAAALAEPGPTTPIRLGGLFDSSRDDQEWREWQLARSRAAQKARAAERENLLQTVQGLLQPNRP